MKNNKKYDSNELNKIIDKDMNNFLNDLGEFNKLLENIKQYDDIWKLSNKNMDINSADGERRSENNIK